jgi:cation-transporting P-type ATPase E
MTETTTIQGLSNQQVAERVAAGEVNYTSKSYGNSYPRILFRNIFSLINLVVFPLLALLVMFQQYTDVLAFGIFLVINTIVSILDEIRTKQQLDKLKEQFQKIVTVIREGAEQQVPVDQVVKGEFVKANEGDGIIADGEIVHAHFLQVDESMLTGESDYLRKEVGDTLLSGGFIVTGACVYKVNNVGKANYLNRLGEATLKYGETKSSIQRYGDQLITGLVIISIVLGVLNVAVTGDAETADRVRSLTTIISLIIPQTLIFLFTLTFTISTIKLYRLGVLVQKSGSIQDLAEVDTICLDKTGTITTNQVFVSEVHPFNVEIPVLASFYNRVKTEIVGQNKTQQVLAAYFAEQDPEKAAGNVARNVGGNVAENVAKNVDGFDQIPFTSKEKYSAISGKFDGQQVQLTFGAQSVLAENMVPELRAEIERFVAAQETAGNRVVVGLWHTGLNGDGKTKSIADLPPTNAVAVFALVEELNPGIGELLRRFEEQEIDVKIISGDSLRSVSHVAGKVGLDVSKIFDLSTVENRENADWRVLVQSYTIFTRASPEDKLEIINALKSAGRKVAMVGDGVNDVLSLKAADVSIAMESGTSITRDVSDVVLLGNDYTKIPDVFYEGENIIFNMKLTTKMFMVKALFGALLAIVFTAMFRIVPFNPASTLIFSFLGTSAPSYVLIFARQKVYGRTDFMREVLRASIPNALIFIGVIMGAFFYLENLGKDYMEINTTLVLLTLALSIIYSLYLVYEAGKLKNILAGIVTFTVIMILAVYQTVLPLTDKNANDRAILLAGIGLGVAILIGFVTFVVKPKTFKGKLFAYTLTWIWVPIVWVFPFQDYYKVVSIPLANYAIILGASAVALLLIVPINLLLKSRT